VLPFADMSPAKDQEYFSDGVAEEILDALAQVEGLRVAGRTSSFSFKGKGDDLRSIGEKLNVGTILEGSVRKEGNRVRITAQLVNATDGFHLWSETFDRELTGVFAAQDEISRAVVDALKIRLMPAQPARRPTTRPEVYNEYLLGKQFFHKLTLDNYRRAAAAFERALALDPGFAPAWAGLGMATFWVADVADTTAQISAGYERALAAAEKAVALEPGQVDGYAARGFLRSAIRWDWEGARSDFERALAINPGDSENHQRYGVAVLGPLGRLDEATREVRKATELDPLSAVAWSSLGRLYWIGGQLDEARIALERSLRILPEQNYAASNLALTLVLQNRPAEALAAAEQSTHELFRAETKALALHGLGRTAEADRLFQEMIARWSDAGAFQIAETYAWFGDRERALQWLERAYAQHDSGLPYLRSDALLRSLHGDPRFAALLRKMKLPPE
jgi:TolB-like protein/Flp pilus assembly protein TadD